MKKALRIACGALLLAAGCRQPPAPAPWAALAPPPAGGGPPARQPAQRPPKKTQPLDLRASFGFNNVSLPDVISRLSRDQKLAVAISPTIPAEEWAKHRVCLRMKDVTIRALLDWLVRPLRAQYATEADGAAWVSRSDDLLEDEALEVRTRRVPTHLTSYKPVRGALVFEREQAAVLDTLRTCLRYIEERRPGCRVAFMGGQDLLVARLPPRGHTRLDALLDAMRYGSPLPELPKPSAVDIRARLEALCEWDASPAPASEVLFGIAEAGDLNLGWDTAAVGDRIVVIPRGKHKPREMLDAVIRQTGLARYELEPGRGVWLHAKGQDANAPSSGATPWDRAVVRAYEVRPILAQMTPEALLAHLRKQVDPAEWSRGLPAASVFLPTMRLIVVHDEAGQRRVAAVVRELSERHGQPPATPPEPD